MSIHERLKYLREQLNLTTRVFGASINMSGGAITNMEKGMRNITDRTVRDICREYNINPDWLVNGNEPMCEDIVKDLDINEEVKQLSKQYSLLCDEDRELVKNIINSLSEKIKALHQTESATIQTETQTVPFLCGSNPTHPADEVELTSRPRELEYKKTVAEMPEAEALSSDEQELKELHTKLDEAFAKEKKQESQASSAKERDVG